MRTSSYIFIIAKPILESMLLMGAFSLAYFLRTITDGIPFIQLRIPFISWEQFFPYVAAGILLWLVTFGQRWLYWRNLDDIPLVEEIRRVLIAGFIWLIAFVGLIYFATGPIFSKEIPRLIVLYAFIFSMLSSLTFRSLLRLIYEKNKQKLHQRFLIVYTWEKEDAKQSIGLESHICDFLEVSQEEKILQYLKQRKANAVILALDNPYANGNFVFEQAKIYGVSCMYPQILPHMAHFSRRERFIGTTPMIELSAISIGFWESFFKRIFDIIISSLALIILSPVLLFIYIGIKIEDVSGPAIYKNKRVWKNGKTFTLYKFRYMYWKDCTKEAYGEQHSEDTAIAYEEELKQKQNTRKWPLYKIKNDPRKMKFGRWIEKFSLDELPQLINVLRWDMSLIGPRPHQPREVALYNESDKQVLTVKPGITGMAQVYGRDKNSFQEEVAYDIYYIENYSFTLDIALFVRTVFVVLGRPFSRSEK